MAWSASRARPWNGAHHSSWRSGSGSSPGSPIGTPAGDSSRTSSRGAQAAHSGGPSARHPMQFAGRARSRAWVAAIRSRSMASIWSSLARRTCTPTLRRVLRRSPAGSILSIERACPVDRQTTARRQARGHGWPARWTPVSRDPGTPGQDPARTRVGAPHQSVGDLTGGAGPDRYGDGRDDRPDRRGASDGPATFPTTTASIRNRLIDLEPMRPSWSSPGPRRPATRPCSSGRELAARTRRCSHRWSQAAVGAERGSAGAVPRPPRAPPRSRPASPASSGAAASPPRRPECRRARNRRRPPGSGATVIESVRPGRAEA